jgi:hypothetical protein
MNTQLLVPEMLRVYVYYSGLIVPTIVSYQNSGNLQLSMTWKSGSNDTRSFGVIASYLFADSYTQQCKVRF